MAELATSRTDGHSPPDVGLTARSDFTPDAALAALTLACQLADLSLGRAELIRLGSNAVFRLDGNIIARVAPTAALLTNSKKQIAVARWLSSEAYPAARAIDILQPVVADGRVVTFWESVAEETVYAPIADVAALIKRLHKLNVPTDLVLPRLQPFGSVADDIPDFPGLQPEVESFLRQRFDWARRSFSSMAYELPSGVVHGDANVGNVLRRPDGEAVLIDLDSFACGPREWDLIQTAIFYDRLGWHSAEEYQTFVDVYGYDITGWDGYSDLAEMREIAMTVWLGRKASESPQAVAETTKRIEAIRTGGSRRDWAAH